MTGSGVDTQVISNLVVRNADGAVLFVRYDADSDKWWLPGADVAPFTHPDETAAKVMQAFEGLEVGACALSHVESFRGRRGWHLVFHYDVTARGEPRGAAEAKWFPRDAMPRTIHGDWEKQAVARITGS